MPRVVLRSGSLWSWVPPRKICGIPSSTKGAPMPRALQYLTLLLSAASPLAAQAHQPSQPSHAPPTLGSADYAKWETLGANALSADGKWVAYDLRRGNGSTELHYRSVPDGAEHVVRSANAPQITSN